ncbi:hypothetical protein SLE2022_160840 [Rubroshorea leprosula]
MLDGLLGRGFASKSKSLIKLTKSRINLIRRKRNATQKFLKKDIADLLANGLDTNAYGRIEGLQVELNVSQCYDFIENCCDFLLKRLSVMQKQRGCPEDCREAVSSLMFAAARFSDLPELRDLRNIFHERYGNSLEFFVNQLFVEILASKPSTSEKKAMLMQEIALEFSIKWDCRAFEQRISKPAAFAEGQPRTYGPSHDNDDKSKSSNGKVVYLQGNKTNISSKEKFEVVNIGHRFSSGKEDNCSKRNKLNSQSRQESSFEGYKPINGREGRDNHDVSSWGRNKVSAGQHEVWNGKEDITSRKGRASSYSHRRSMDKNDGGTRNELNLQRKQESFEGYKPPNGMEGKDNHEVLPWGRKEASAAKHEFWNGKEDITSSKGRLSNSSHGRIKDRNDCGAKLPEVKENNVYGINEKDMLPQAKQHLSPSHAGLNLKSHDKDLLAGDSHGMGDTTRNVREDTPHLKPYYNDILPPPYIKPNTKLKDSNHDARLSIGSSSAGLDNEIVSKDPSEHHKAFAGNRSDKNQEGLDHPHDKRSKFSPARVDSHGGEKDYYYQNGGIDNPIPKPRSNRRRHHVKSSRKDDFDNDEHAGAARRRSRGRGDDSSRGLQVLFDYQQHKIDEEERVLDELLIHYSKSPSSYEEGKVRRKQSRSHRAHHHLGTEAGETPSNVSRDGFVEKSEIPCQVRSISLPCEQTTQPQAKVFARAASFQPQRSNAERHVHPNLPDYDDLAAQLAALRGR